MHSEGERGRKWRGDDRLKPDYYEERAESDRTLHEKRFGATAFDRSRESSFKKG
jgi:hypothetical protein